MRDATDHGDPRAGRGTLRAGLWGLCAGMVLGGLYLLVAGVRSRLAPPDCTGYSDLECTLLLGAAMEVSRVQILAGGALVALGMALGVLLRPRLSSR
jgi:hypothetical protein